MGGRTREWFLEPVEFIKASVPQSGENSLLEQSPEGRLGASGAEAVTGGCTQLCLDPLPSRHQGQTGWEQAWHSSLRRTVVRELRAALRSQRPSSPVSAISLSEKTGETLASGSPPSLSSVPGTYPSCPW